MELSEAKEKFVQAWGTLGSNWGVSRTMAQIHALLVTSPEAMSTEEIMEDLKISRGNANMNLRDLIDWGLIRKETKAGERKEYFYAEKDMWKAFIQVVKERRRRELEPIFRVLDEVHQVDDKKSKEAKAFLDSINGIQDLAAKADSALEILIKADESKFWGTFLKLFR